MAQTAPHAASPPALVSVLPLWSLWILFVVYGSLVPLQAKPIAFDLAWERFTHLPMLDLGVTERADWIANGVLYLPVGLLTTLLLSRHTASLAARMLCGALALGFSVALALAVEFTQLYFPQRTVSLNDVYAECIGSLLGVLLATGWGTTALRALQALAGRTHWTVGRAGLFYLALYAAYSLFPYDLLLSSQELAQKIASNQWGWLVAGSVGARPLAWAGQTIAEVLLTIPLGFAFAHGGGRAGRRPGTGAAVLAGVGLGLVIEIFQFFIASGVSQGWSVATRGVGCAIGALLWTHRAALERSRLQRLAAQWTPWLALPYLLALVTFSGWFSSSWTGTESALERLRHDVRFLPFYYHYFTTEAKALFSLASVAMMYLPIGIAGWARGWHPPATAGAAAIAAVVVEAGKLFAQEARPDPTNVLIAAAAVWMACKLLRLSPAATAGPPTRTRPTEAAAAIAAHGSSPTRVLLAGLAVAGCLVWALGFPVLPWALAAGLAAYAAMVWRLPAAPFFFTPALLPVLDLAPFSGRLFFDEYDALMIVGLAVGFARTARRQPAAVLRHHRLLRLLCALMGGALLVGICRALLPWPSLDANAFNNYFSPFNALRIAKGGLWAMLLLWLAMRQAEGWRPAAQRFGQGLVAGLAFTVLAVLWERHAFTRIFDFADQYRVTGPFSAMHTGGAYVECFLVTATPFLVHGLARAHGLALRVAGGLLLLGTTYAVMVTFSRGGYVAFGLALLLGVAGILQTGPARRRGWLAGAMMLAAAAAVALPVLTGGFAQTRLADTQQDLGIRQRHWSGALALHEGDWTRSLLGLGIGGFPAAHYWSSPDNARTGIYQLFAQDGNTGLRLGSGHPLYLEQIIDVQPYTPYQLRLSVRSHGGTARVVVMLCHKWLLTSHDCQSFSFAPPEGSSDWTVMGQRLNSSMLGADPLDAKRPVKIAIYSSGSGILDVDDVRLEDARGRDVLRNGDFSAGLDRWHFTSDAHLAWHVKNLPLAWYVEQGALGLSVLVLWLAAAVWRAGRGALHADALAAVLLSSVAAFLAVGIFDALLDTPRFLMLLLVLSGFALALRDGDTATNTMPAARAARTRSVSAPPR